MGYEWDHRKAELNRQQHGIDLADAVGVFEDAYAITIPDERHEESRFVTVGMDTLGRVLVVVHTWRGERIRIISARRATRRERCQYEG
jgi:uncharacterized DUF497 family protein